MADRQESFEFIRRYHGLSPLAAAQVQNMINVRIIVELVERLGGEVELSEGFPDRAAAATHVAGTRFDDNGTFRVWVEPIADENNHAGQGTRWERVEGSEKKGRHLSLYEVDSEGGPIDQGGDGTVTLRRINRDGTPLDNFPLVTVPAARLLRGAGGWRRWIPPDEVVEDVAGD